MSELTQVKIGTETYDLDHITAERAGQLYAALGNVPDAKGKSTAKYQQLADQMAVLAKNIQSIRRIGSPGLIQKVMDSVDKTTGKLKEGVGLDIKAGYDKLKDIPGVAQALGIVEGGVSAVGVAYDFGDGAVHPGKPFFELLGAGGAALSELADKMDRPMGDAQAKAFGAGYAASVYKTVEAKPIETGWFSSFGGFFTHITSFFEHVWKDIVPNSWVANLNAAVSFVFNGFKDWDTCKQQAVAEAAHDRSEKKSYADRVQDNLMADVNKEAREKAAATFKAAGEIAGESTETFANALADQSLYRDQHGVVNELTFDKGTGAPKVDPIKDKDGNPVTANDEIWEHLRKVGDHSTSYFIGSGLTGMGGVIVLAAGAKPLARGFVRELVGHEKSGYTRAEDLYMKRGMNLENAAKAARTGRKGYGVGKFRVMKGKANLEEAKRLSHEASRMEQRLDGVLRAAAAREKSLGNKKMPIGDASLVEFANAPLKNGLVRRTMRALPMHVGGMLAHSMDIHTPTRGLTLDGQFIKQRHFGTLLRSTFETLNPLYLPKRTIRGTARHVTEGFMKEMIGGLTNKIAKLDKQITDKRKLADDIEAGKAKKKFDPAKLREEATALEKKAQSLSEKLDARKTVAAANRAPLSNNSLLEIAEGAKDVSLGRKIFDPRRALNTVGKLSAMVTDRISGAEPSVKTNSSQQQPRETNKQQPKPEFHTSEARAKAMTPEEITRSATKRLQANEQTGKNRLAPHEQIDLKKLQENGKLTLQKQPETSGKAQQKPVSPEELARINKRLQASEQTGKNRLAPHEQIDLKKMQEGSKLSVQKQPVQELNGKTVRPNEKPVRMQPEPMETGRAGRNVAQGAQARFGEVRFDNPLKGIDRITSRNGMTAVGALPREMAPEAMLKARPAITEPTVKPAAVELKAEAKAGAPRNGMSLALGAQMLQHIEMREKAGEKVSATEKFAAYAATGNGAVELAAGRSIETTLEKSIGLFAPKLARAGGPLVQAAFSAPMIVSAYKSGDTYAIGSATIGTGGALSAGLAAQAFIPIPGIGFAVGIVAGDGAAKIGGLANTMLFNKDAMKAAEAKKELINIGKDYSPLQFSHIGPVPIPTLSAGSTVNLAGATVSSVGHAVNALGDGVSWLGNKCGISVPVGKPVSWVGDRVDDLGKSFEWAGSKINGFLGFGSGKKVDLPFESPSMAVPASVSGLGAQSALSLAGPQMDAGLGHAAIDAHARMQQAQNAASRSGQMLAINGAHTAVGALTALGNETPKPVSPINPASSQLVFLQ